MKKKPKRRGKYGYVEFVDKRKLKYDGYDDNIEPEIRKPTLSEREEIILNYIRANSGKSVEVWWLAEKLAVSDRTIQKILKKFEEQGLISRTPVFTDTGKQKCNILTYLGEDKTVKRNELTLRRLYDPDNPCGVGGRSACKERNRTIGRRRRGDRFAGNYRQQKRGGCKLIEFPLE